MGNAHPNHALANSSQTKGGNSSSPPQSEHGGDGGDDEEKSVLQVKIQIEIEIQIQVTIQIRIQAKIEIQILVAGKVDQLGNQHWVRGDGNLLRHRSHPLHQILHRRVLLPGQFYIFTF